METFRQSSKNSKQHNNKRCFPAKLCWPSPVFHFASLSNENSDCTALKSSLVVEQNALSFSSRSKPKYDLGRWGDE